MRKKIYEDVLDDIDEIEPDVAEPDADGLLEDGFSHTFMFVIPSGYTEYGAELVVESIRSILEMYCDSWRTERADTNEAAALLDNAFGRYDRVVFMQFNAPEKPGDLIRLVLRLFSTVATTFYLVERTEDGFRVTMSNNGASIYAVDLISKRENVPPIKLNALIHGVSRMAMKSRKTFDKPMTYETERIVAKYIERNKKNIRMIIR